jgi:3',5'-cyclic AMP phosphodiesterase CpdA
MVSFTFAHLSDTHIRIPDTLLFNGVDSRKQLQKAIDWILSGQLAIDATILSGDLTQDGLLEEYVHLKEILKPLQEKMPVYFVMGNHDNFQNFIQIFSDFSKINQCQAQHCLQYSFQMGDYRCVVLDSLETADDQGHLRPERLLWLDQALQTIKDKTILVIHHPMISIGNPLMDDMHLFESDAFGEIVQKYPQVKMILCGHIHRTIFGRFRDIPVMVAPSTAHQYPVNLTHESAKILSQEAPGFLIHMQVDGEILTHQIPISTNT